MREAGKRKRDRKNRKNKGINAQKCKLERGTESVIKTKINLIFFYIFFLIYKNYTLPIILD